MKNLILGLLLATAVTFSLYTRRQLYYHYLEAQYAGCHEAAMKEGLLYGEEKEDEITRFCVARYKQVYYEIRDSYL